MSRAGRTRIFPKHIRRGSSSRHTSALACNMELPLGTLCFRRALNRSRGSAAVLRLRRSVCGKAMLFRPSNLMIAAQPPLSGFAARCAEKLCFSGEPLIDQAAQPPSFGYAARCAEKLCFSGEPLMIRGSAAALRLCRSVCGKAMLFRRALNPSRGYAARCAEKLCFSGRASYNSRLRRPPFDLFVVSP
jgi:hypothetical protein